MANPDRDPAFVVRMEKAAVLAGNATELARRTGISRRAIGDYLAGESEPSRPRLIAIARAVGVSVEWLATGAEPMIPTAEAPSADGESPGETPAPPAARPVDELLFDEDALVQVLAAVELELADQGLQAAVEDKARLAAAMYRLQLRRLQRPGAPAEARQAIRADLRDVLAIFDALHRTNSMDPEPKP